MLILPTVCYLAEEFTEDLNELRLILVTWIYIQISDLLPKDHKDSRSFMFHMEQYLEEVSSE